MTSQRGLTFFKPKNASKIMTLSNFLAFFKLNSGFTFECRQDKFVMKTLFHPARIFIEMARRPYEEFILKAEW